MPIKRASFKDLRKSKRRHARNISTRSDLHSAVKRFESLVAAKKTDEAREFLGTVISKIAKAGAKGVIHPNTASRKISRLTKRLSAARKA
jgi:small subunit ribosomal protein S20